MHIRIFAAALAAVIVTGCTSYSGPTHNTDVITLTTGEQAWRVQCQGLVESAKSCIARAKDICKDQPIRLLGAADRMNSGLLASGDPRELTFMCGAKPEPAVTPAPAPAPTPAPARKPLRSLSLEGDANFATDSAGLTPQAQAKLDRFIAESQGYAISRVTIYGHTDSTGPLAHNQELSVARARSAQEYLVSHGLKSDAYDVRGFGPSRPIASNATQQGRAQNRRVDIESNGIEIRATGR
ncbi:hypothetical protein A9R05_12675 [Burkholderia sp. KK1]|nr:hypothetical protein A9R05_12675 [Burkholderia sp. KK1]